jgi:hypothetical protein
VLAWISVMEAGSEKAGDVVLLVKIKKSISESL